MAIDCMYSCPTCGLIDAKVSVPERAAEEDVVHWLEQKCIPATGADHCLRSPACRATRFANLKIPVLPGTTRVGEKPSS